MIQVVIADDIQILRQGLKAILSQDKDIWPSGDRSGLQWQGGL